MTAPFVERAGPPESALIVTVPEAESVVGEWRRRYDPSAGQGIPAHITLLYPFLDPHRIDDRVVGELKDLFARAPALRFRLVEVGRFPDVLYLAPEPAEPFERLTAAVATLFPEAPPYRGAHETVVPHLTVAHSEDAGLLRRIEEQVASQLPIEASAHDVWLVEERDGHWHLRTRFPLASG